jgi:hypothetical protein
LLGDAIVRMRIEGMHWDAGGRRGRELFSGVGRNMGVRWDGMGSEGMGEG